MSGLHVDKIANSGAISLAVDVHIQQPSDTVCTTEQLVHARMGASEQAATSADCCASTMGSLQVAEIADSSVVSQVYGNRSEGEGLQHSPSMVGIIGQAKNTQLGSLHTVAATSANSYAPTISRRSR